ncbi:hypothetical protein SG34_006265 [Thalassomonas viridans]|uniref:Bacterial toxin 43 domain-containing protein n=1 Tax=Thalassomonas viridans TaxID=137584 RepID=A0AAE9Z4D6_9GAMM|nr:polymorphic toxin type 43 domain-containing protein [Thalassomonas viridans]WDE06521.1 hypothetical protein SG34_006265 [Thalassomonas viridans]
MNHKNKNTWLASGISLLLALTANQASAAGKITDLAVNNDVATFYTEEAKEHGKISCVTGDETAWAVSTSDNDGVYPLLNIALEAEQAVEVAQGTTCLSNPALERPQSVKINYSASGSDKPVISSQVSFVARSKITLAEGGNSKVEFGLTAESNGTTWIEVTEKDGYYTADFGQLSAGNYSLKTKVTIDSDTEIETTEFIVRDNTRLVYQDESGNLFVRILGSQGDQYLKLSSVNGTWQIEALSKSTWDSLNVSAMERTDYSLAYEDVNGDSLNDLSLLAANGSVVFKATKDDAGYSELLAWLETGGTVSDVQLDEPTVATSTFNGVIAGSASVSGGAAAYNIPIVVPPGRNKMQPSVALSYSSRSGNGIAGVGWSLSAGGSISRCPQTVAQDGIAGTITYTSSDRLCFNGQRLLVTNASEYGASGATYTTELDSFMTVTQTGALSSTDAKFTVQLANGSKQYYQQTVVPGGKASPLSWLLSRSEDVSGKNHMTYQYQDYGDGEVLLTNILYTGDGTTDGNRKVTFTYEDRATNAETGELTEGQYSSRYLAGGKTRQTMRLAGVSTHVGDSEVRNYSLNYQASASSGRALLESVDECAGGVCREQTSMSWFDNVATYKTQLLTNSAGTELYPGPSEDLYKLLPHGDRDGDGVSDWPGYSLNAEGDSTTNSFELKNCTVNRFQSSYQCVEGDFNLDGRTDGWSIQNGKLQIDYTGGDTGTTDIDLEGVEDSGFGSYEDVIKHVADYNADGWPDIMVLRYNNRNPYINLYLHTQNLAAPFAVASETLVFSYDTEGTSCHNNEGFGSCYTIDDLQYLGDMDGNGLPDLAILKEVDTAWDEGNLHVRLLRLTNLNSDGSISFTDKVFDLGQAGTRANYNRFFDVNSDGLADWIGWYQFNDESGSDLYYSLNKGNGVFTTPVSLGVGIQSRYMERFELSPSTGIKELDSSTIVPKFASAMFTMDVDGDGRSELIMPSTIEVEGCYQLEDGKDGANTVYTTFCGTELYGEHKYFTEARNLTQSISSQYDTNIYRYKALHFVESSDGTIQGDYRATDLIAGVSNAQVIDAFGNGLTDLVFNYGCENPRCEMGTVTAGSPLAGKAQGIYFNRNFGSTTAASPGKADYQPADMLQKVTNGVDLVSQWHYRPLSSGKDGAFYDTAHDVIDSEHFYFASSMYAVQSFKQSNGVGGLNEKTYQYRGAVYNHQGRGFRGFKTIIDTDVANDMRTETHFKQKFPYSGLVEEQRQFQDSVAQSQPFRIISNEWEENTNYTGVGYHLYNTDARNISCVIGATTCSWTENLSRSQTVILQDDIDKYGNVSKSTTTKKDNYGTYETEKGATFDIADALWPHKVKTQYVKNIAVNYGVDPITPTTGTNVDKTVKSELTWYEDSSQSNYRRLHKIITTGDDSSTTTETTYTTYGLPASVTVTGNVLNSGGEAIKQIRSTTTLYSADGYFPKSISKKASASVNHVISMTTDAKTGQPLSVTDVTGVVTTNTYDVFGRLLSKSQTGMPNQTIRYYTPDTNKPNNNAVMMTVTRQAGSPETAVYLDKLGRTLRSRSKDFAGSNVYKDIAYNARGLKTHVSNPHNGIASNTVYSDFDLFGRPGQKITPQTNGKLTTKYTYDEVDGETKIVVTPDVGTEITVYRTFNALKQLVSTTDADGGKTHYRYDGQGNPIVIKDAKGAEITASYDALGRKSWVDDPNMGKSTFVYNDFGELESENNANGKTTSYEVDFLGRVTGRNADGSQADFVWDTKVKGLPTSHSENGIKKSFTYDSAARVTKTIVDIGGSYSASYETSIAYDGNYGRVKATTYPDGLVLGYEYNEYGYLTKEYNAASGYSYREITGQDSLGNVTAVSLGDGAAISLEASYSAVSGQMLSTKATGAELGMSKVIHDLFYGESGYDSYGNITSQSNGVAGMEASETFVYDGLHRLTSATVSAMGGDATIYYAYDAVGNITKKSDYSANTADAYVYVDGSNKIQEITLQDNSKVTFDYDAMGNQTKRNGNNEVAYNTFNKPVTINKNNAQLAFTYGADLSRYLQQRTVNGKTITTHYIDKAYEVEFEGSQRKSRTYIGSTAIITDGNQEGDKTLRFTLRDRLGSTTTFADHNGYARVYRHFDPFGKPRNGEWSLLSGFDAPPRLDANLTANELADRRGFTDHEHLDEVELIHMNGRVYDYNVGRFMSVDPVIQEPGNSQSINPYSYLMNNPMAGTDPTGYMGCAASAIDAKCQSLSSAQGGFKESAMAKQSALSAGISLAGRAARSNGAVKQVLQTLSKQIGMQRPIDIGSQKSVSEGQESNNSGGYGDEDAGFFDKGCLNCRYFHGNPDGASDGLPGHEMFDSIEEGYQELFDLLEEYRKNMMEAYIEFMITGITAEIGGAILGRAAAGYINGLKAARGSGPAPGMLSLHAASKSNKAVLNYTPKNNQIVEYIFDTSTNTFVVGVIKNNKSVYKHYQLATAIGANRNTPTIVGGMLHRGKNGALKTDEYSGTFYENWNAQTRRQFVEGMKKLGVTVEHSM